MVRQLKQYRNIEPNADWAVFARANFVRILDSDTKLSTLSEQRELKGFLSSAPSEQSEPRGFRFGLLLRPAPRLAFAAFSVFVLAIGAFYFGFANNTQAPQANLGAAVSSEQSDESVDAYLVPEAARVVLNNNVPMTVAESPAESSRVLTVIGAYEEGSDIAFRTALRERLNRVTVLAQENKDIYVQQLASKAEELFGKYDYDAALRVIVLAENLLN